MVIEYLCVQLDRIKNLVERASGLYDIPLEIVDILRSAQDSFLRFSIKYNPCTCTSRVLRYKCEPTVIDIQDYPNT